jgi:hypothetical protein
MACYAGYRVTEPTITTGRFDWNEKLAIPHLRQTTPAPRSDHAQKGHAWAYRFPEQAPNYLKAAAMSVQCCWREG